ncbi:dUTP diphosphatase, partial [Staphylococcus aureus]
FKNWKKTPGQMLDVQIDELADLLAFGLSIANHIGVSSEEIKEAIESSFKDTEFNKMFIFKDKEFAQDAVGSTPQIIFKESYPNQQAIVTVIDIAYTLYS